MLFKCLCRWNVIPRASKQSASQAVLHIPYAAVVLKSAGGLLAFQTQLDRTWIVLLLSKPNKISDHLHIIQLNEWHNILQHKEGLPQISIVTISRNTFRKQNQMPQQLGSNCKGHMLQYSLYVYTPLIACMQNYSEVKTHLAELPLDATESECS